MQSETKPFDPVLNLTEAMQSFDEAVQKLVAASSFTSVVWVEGDPPEPSNIAKHQSRIQWYDKVAAILAEKPGQWALVEITSTRPANGPKSPWVRRGCEFKVRKDDRGHVVYARYIGNKEMNK